MNALASYHAPHQRAPAHHSVRRAVRPLAMRFNKILITRRASAELQSVHRRAPFKINYHSYTRNNMRRNSGKQTPFLSHASLTVRPSQYRSAKPPSAHLPLLRRPQPSSGILEHCDGANSWSQRAAPDPRRPGGQLVHRCHNVRDPRRPEGQLVHPFAC